MLLICVFLVFQMECCTRSSLKAERPLCNGRPFASPLFRRLAGRGPFFRGFPFRWALQLTVSLARCLTYTMSCLFFASPEPIRIVAVDSARPMSLEWPTGLLAGSDQSNPSSSHEDLLDEHRGDALLAPPQLRWRSDCSSTTSSTKIWCRLEHVSIFSYGGFQCVT